MRDLGFLGQAGPIINMKQTNRFGSQPGQSRVKLLVFAVAT